MELIVSRYESLTSGEREQLVTGLSRFLGKTVRISASDMTSYSEDDLRIIGDVLQGIILTKENVPNLSEIYQGLDVENLPNQISFGRKEKDE
ncbi:hypothetical protein [Cohnella sp. GCM10027633]|uniref:hypothetical protein n=1 Tax=unclassified Cohnella TaxID=2636738 RepID=UPI00363EBF2C